jgi:hypothetical protein
VKYRGRVADRTFERRSDAVRWEKEQKRLHSGEFVAPPREAADLVGSNADNICSGADRSLALASCAG